MISVCVLTYNPSWDKLRRTLFSILNQKNVEFEIVVADDGSKNNYFDKVKEYFSDKGFKNFTCVENLVNQGTVQNVLSALKVAKGKFVKLISPGDYFVNELSLFTVYNEALKNPDDVYFGKAVYYSNENEIQIYPNIRCPSDLRPYLSGSIDKIKKAYFVKQEFIVGASFFVNRQNFKEALTVISDVVKYAEDNAVLVLLAKGFNIHYVPCDFIFYEYGAGVSTGANSKWAQIIGSENKNTYTYLYNNSLISQKIYDYHFNSSKKDLLYQKVMIYSRKVYNLFHRQRTSESVYKALEFIEAN